MLYYLHELESLFGPFRVFEYFTFRALGAGMTAFLLCLVLGPTVIRLLSRLKLGQPIRGSEEVHKLAELHGGKKGTPTMGGLLLLLTLVGSVLLWCDLRNHFLWMVLIPTLLFGAIGFLDDFLKIRKKKSEGLNSKQKLVAQIIVSVVAGLVLLYHPETGDAARSLQIPFFKEPLLEMWSWVALIFFTFVMVGCSNAVNLTDGLDGLATGCTVPVAAVFAVFAYVSSNANFAEYLFIDFTPGAEELTVFCAALGGAAAGFLWFNCHPARVFMGDTGSLAIGGALALVSICLNQELLLVIVGGIFVMEALSVIIQVISFKTTGKRVFAMSPLHHHFELKGWSETTVVTRFWILALFFSLLALSTLKLR